MLCTLFSISIRKCSLLNNLTWQNRTQISVNLDHLSLCKSYNFKFEKSLQKIINGFLIQNCVYFGSTKILFWVHIKKFKGYSMVRKLLGNKPQLQKCFPHRNPPLISVLFLHLSELNSPSRFPWGDFQIITKESESISVN